MLLYGFFDESHSFALLFYCRALRFLGHCCFSLEWRTRRRALRGIWRRGLPSPKLLRVLLLSSTQTLYTCVKMVSHEFLKFFHLRDLFSLFSFLFWTWKTPPWHWRLLLVKINTKFRMVKSWIFHMRVSPSVTTV